MTFEQVDLPMTWPEVTAIAFDRSGAMWVGSSDGLYRRGPGANAKRYSTASGLPNDYIMALLEDRQGWLWIGTRIGLVRMDPLHPTVMRIYTQKDGLPENRIASLFQSSNGAVWVGTTLGLAEWTPGATDGREFHGHTLTEGLSARYIGPVAEDRDGNLWVATPGSGVMKIARSGFTTFDGVDGVPQAHALLETPRGEFVAVLRDEMGLALGHFDGTRFRPVRPAWPRRISNSGWGARQIALQDRAGEWWIATGEGLARFSAASHVEDLAGSAPKAIYGAHEGLPCKEVFRIFEDSHGNIWIGAQGSEDCLAVWDRATGQIHSFSQADGLPQGPLPTSFAEDHAGNLWIGLYHESIARYRSGRFAFFTVDDGVPGFVSSINIDSAGRLWISGSRGLVRVDDPTQESIHFVRYGRAEGLSSDDIADTVEDRWGRVYAATGRGIDRFEPGTGGLSRIKHYTNADGIAAGELELAFRDHRGDLWFTTALGVSRLTPTLDPPMRPVPILITGIAVDGMPQSISDLGETAVRGLHLLRGPIRFDFTAISYAPGETLRYQYMLEGADTGWSSPSEERSVVFANLAPRGYRFLVRAVNSAGAASSQPAVVAFAIPPPFWRSGWFVFPLAAVIALLLYGLHRYRVARLLAVAAVRARIASDLHDDIASSLSQVVILSEVAQTSPVANGDGKTGTLAEIAEISREVLDSLSDIVWAINPDNDHLSNLVHRMRRFSGDLLAGYGIALDFRSSMTDQDLPVGAYVRRQIYLVFKEAIHNIARHSRATRVEVSLERIDGRLILHCRDNGVGFDPGSEFEGSGLMNMRKRAASVGGGLKLHSQMGGGATVELDVRVAAARTLAALRGK
jgi:signal transduction histidine kinase/streptogramin lyase